MIKLSMKNALTKCIMVGILTTCLSLTAYAQLTGQFSADSMGESGQDNISDWAAINKDVKAWLKIPGTNIDLPVVIGDDNDEYLELDYYRRASVNGVLWADSYTEFGEADEISKNTVIYGHNWTNVSATPKVRDANDVMFAQLPAYQYIDFAKETPYIYYSTDDEEMVWQVFATFYTDTDFYYIRSNPNKEQFVEIVKGALARSLHNFDTEITTSDNILTLSTCTRAYGASADQRFVVMAKLLTEEEAKVLEAVEVTPNTDFIAPKL